MEEELAQEAHARVGSTIGKYRLDAVLGVGGAAAVYAGTHRNGNRVAIKVLHQQYAADESMRSRFLREGYVANKVDHPGTVRVLDDDTTNDLTYLVMDLLEGETLEQRSRRVGGKLPVPDVVHHGIALLEVLERAHAAGIVHRDLKPENLFFTTRQELKVLDFGIARLRDATVKATTTQMGTMLGTPGYLAPEQALGNVNDIDARTDVWATGATLFTLLTGRPVHQGRSAQESLVFAATRPAPPLKQYAPHVPDHVALVIDRALRFRREERWPNAAEMRGALVTTGLARLTVPTALTGPLVAPVVDPSRQAATIMTSTAGARSSSTSSIALAGLLFGLVTLGGIVGGLLYLKRRNAGEVTSTPEIASAASAEPEIEQLPLPSAQPAATIEPVAEPLPARSDLDASAAVEPPKPVVVAAPPPKPVPAPARSAAPKDPWDPR
ncbi:MAG: serine/threonine-protein kinase [Labilithrix sp.]